MFSSKSFIDSDLTFRSSIHFQFIFVYVVRKCYNFIFLHVDVQFFHFPCGSTGKESTCNSGGLGSIPGLGRSPGEGKGYLLQYSGLKNFMNCCEKKRSESKGEKERYKHLNAEFPKNSKER